MDEQKIQEESRQLQKAPAQMNMRPIWEYAKSVRYENGNRHRPIKMNTGDHAKVISQKNYNAGKTG